MSTRKRGSENSVLKGLRIFIVFLSWIVVVTTSNTSMELLRSALLFMLGLLYDYLCLYDATVVFGFQKGIAILGLVMLGFVGLIEACGFLGVLQQSIENPKILVMVSSSNILADFSIDTHVISWLLLIFPFVAGLEFVSLFVRGNKQTVQYASQ